MKNLISFLLAAVIASFKSATSVDSIVASIDKKVDELMAHAQASADAAVNHDVKAEKIVKKAQAARGEALRAQRIAQRIDQLVR